MAQVSLPHWHLRERQELLIPVPLGPDLRPLDDVPEQSPSERNRWLLFAPALARLTARLEDLVFDFARRRPDIDIIYGDEVVERGQDTADVMLKPSINPSYLLATDYVGFPLIVRASAFRQLGGLRSEAGSAMFYDLCLRALQEGVGLERMTEIVIRYDGVRPAADPRDQRSVLTHFVSGLAHPFEVLPGRKKDTYQVRRVFAEYPEVTLVVPTRQSVRGKEYPDAGTPHILSFLRSLRSSSWPMDRVEVLIGDDADSEAIYLGEPWPFRVRRIATTRSHGEPFNYAAKMNQLWRRAETDLIVLMNDDIEIQAPDWLEALITFAAEEDVGGVGARPLFPNSTIQHAGMVCGLFGTCAHAWFGQPATGSTYQDWAEVHRDWSVVTGAVFATRRSVLEVVNGFDERLSLEFNDVDLCLRMRTLGYRIVCTPFAELTHFEKSSRGETLPPADEVNLFLKRWRQALGDDPMFHPGMMRDSFDLRPSEDYVADQLGKLSGSLSAAQEGESPTRLPEQSSSDPTFGTTRQQTALS